MTIKFDGTTYKEVDIMPGDISPAAWDVWIQSTFTLYERIADGKLFLACMPKEKPEIKIKDMADLEEFLIYACGGPVYKYYHGAAYDYITVEDPDYTDAVFVLSENEAFPENKSLENVHEFLKLVKSDSDYFFEPFERIDKKEFEATAGADYVVCIVK